MASSKKCDICKGSKSHHKNCPNNPNDTRPQTPRAFAFTKGMNVIEVPDSVQVGDTGIRFESNGTMYPKKGVYTVLALFENLAIVRRDSKEEAEQITRDTAKAAPTDLESRVNALDSKIDRLIASLGA